MKIIYLKLLSLNCLLDPNTAFEMTISGIHLFCLACNRCFLFTGAISGLDLCRWINTSHNNLFYKKL